MPTAPDARDLAAWFAPEHPGPMMYAHVVATGVGRCAVDRWPRPRAVLVSLPGGNHCVRGDPDALDLTGVTGLVEAPARWHARLGGRTWDRMVAIRPDVAAPASGARLLGPSDAAALAALHPECAWIHETWGGPARLATARVARAVVVDGLVVSVAVPFYLGEGFEDIGVVTDPRFRARGLSTACAAAVVADIRRRGRVPSWTTSPDNVASRTVAGRLGFVHARDDVLYAVGVPVP